MGPIPPNETKHFIQFAGSIVLSENSLQDIAVKSQDLGLSLNPDEVKVISEMVNMMGENKTPSNMEIAAIMTRKVIALFCNFLCSAFKTVQLCSVYTFLNKHRAIIVKDKLFEYLFGKRKYKLPNRSPI